VRHADAGRHGHGRVAMAMFSMSMELIHSPPDLITSLLRSVICI
jgi:hypothetical protein